MSNLSGFVKRLRDIMRNDAGINGDAQRIEQIAWMLFLKVYDAKEQDWEFDDEDYVSIIPEGCRWQNWAVDDKSGTAMTGEQLLNFVNNTLFPTLKKLLVDASTPIKKAIVQTTFADANNYMKDGVLLRQVINVIDELDLSDYEETIEDIQHLEELKALREKRKTAFDNESAAYTRFVEQRNETRIAFRETVWNVILKKNDKQFKEAFSGLRSNKDKFRDKVLERFQNDHASEHTYEELVLRSETLYAEKPETCVLFVVPDEELLRATAEVESNSIFQTVIVGNQDIPIGRLIQSLHNSDYLF